MPCISSQEFSHTKGSTVLSIELQVWNERCVALLGQHIAESVTTYLQDDKAVTEDSAIQAELALFQRVVRELSNLLENTPIAIALPVINSSGATTFELTCVAGLEKTVELERSPSFVWQLSTGKQIELQPGQQLTRSKIIQLQTQLRKHDRHLIYPIRGERCEGWLLIGNVSQPNSLRSSQSFQLPLSHATLERIAQQCLAALQQIRLIAKQRQQYQALLEKNQELEQSNQLKSEFLANTSHEIRTPLSSILGFTHLLQQQGFNPSNLRQQEYLKIILSSGQHLLALINDILDLSKIEANQMTLQWEPTNISELCKICMTLVREKASDKGLQLQLELPPAVKTMAVDSLRLKQMLFNLLSNAIKFTPQGTVGLQVTATDGQIHFTVWDSGTGISPEQQALLFKPYSQIANAAVSRSEGTGLGLVLTQKLAELHGGRIEVCSELNQGSRFTVVLPFRDLDCNTDPLINAPINALIKATPQLGEIHSVSRQGVVSKPIVLETIQEADRPGVMGGMNEALTLSCDGATDQQNISFNRVLLVEDNIPNAKLMLTYLSRLGYEVSWAKDGKEMWVALERSLPAIILMDVHLPDADGLALTHQLKQHSRYQSIPVIAQTAMAMKGDRAVCLESGADDYISKPLDLDVLSTLMLQYVPLGVKQ
jgi:hypothetical protein